MPSPDQPQRPASPHTHHPALSLRHASRMYPGLGQLPAQNGLASTSQTIGMKASRGISLIQRSAREDGSALPLATPFNKRPVHTK